MEPQLSYLDTVTLKSDDNGNYLFCKIFIQIHSLTVVELRVSFPDLKLFQELLWCGGLCGRRQQQTIHIQEGEEIKEPTQAHFFQAAHHRIHGALHA